MNKFDRILWRTNGVLFLAILALAVFQLLSSLGPGILTPSSHPSDSEIVSTAQGDREKEVFRLGAPSRIAGTSIFRTPLNGKVPSSGSSFKGSGGESHIRNYLFVDSSDLSSWWLFEGFGRAIMEEHDLRANLEDKEKHVVSTIFEVVTQATNGDHRSKTNGHTAAFFTAADGKKPIEIVSASDRILSVQQVSSSEVLVMYQRGSSVTAALFSVQNGAKIREAPLSTKQDK